MKRPHNARKINMTVLTVAAAVSIFAQAGTSWATPSMAVPDIARHAVKGPVAVKPADSKKLYDRFQAIMKQADRLPKLIAFANEHSAEMTPADASAMIAYLESAIAKDQASSSAKFESPVVQTALQKLYKAGDSFYSLAAKTKDAKLKSLLKTAIATGYRLEIAEGFYFPVVDYHLFDRYHKYLTADIRAYLDLKVAEMEQPSVKDGGLRISYGDVVKRALKQEKFLLEYSTSIRASQVRTMFEAYESFTFVGVNNSPAFDYDTKELNAEAKKAYEAILANAVTDKSAYLTKLQAFMTLLSSNDYKLTAEVQTYIDKNVSVQ